MGDEMVGWHHDLNGHECFHDFCEGGHESNQREIFRGIRCAVSPVPSTTHQQGNVGSSWERCCGKGRRQMGRQSRVQMQGREKYWEMRNNKFGNKISILTLIVLSLVQSLS